MRKHSIGMVHIYITLLKANAHGVRKVLEILHLSNILPYVVYSQHNQWPPKLHPFSHDVLSSGSPRQCPPALSRAGTATSHRNGAPGCATTRSRLPAAQVSTLCPHHLLFTKAHTYLQKQMNNSIMCLAARALSFWFTMEAPHWKDPYTGQGGEEKNLNESPASKHIIKASFPLNTSCFGN